MSARPKKSKTSKVKAKVLNSPKVIFGSGGIPLEKLTAAIQCAGQAGYDTVDTAWLYGNEKEVAKAVSEYNLTNKKKLKIMTKIQPEFSGRIIAQLKSQLKAMGLKKVDIVLLHRPAFDIRKSVDAWEALVKAKELGLTEKIGVSNFDRDMLIMLHARTKVWPEINQIELSVVNMRDDRVAFCKAFGIEVQAWRPTGPDGVATRTPSVIRIAKKRKVEPTQLALAYLINKGVRPVVRSSSPGHIASNKQSEKIRLTRQEMMALAKENKFLTRSSETYDHPYAKQLYYDFLESKA